MSFLTARDVLSSDVPRVLASQSPHEMTERRRKEAFYAVFERMEVRDGERFLGLVTAREASQHPLASFGQLLPKRTPNPITPDTPLAEAVDCMENEEVDGLPVFDERGMFLGVVTHASIVEAVLSHEYSERLRTEKQLRKTEARNRALLNVIPDLMFVISREGFLLDYSCSDPSQLLMPPQKFLGRYLTEVLPAGLAKDILVIVRQTLENGAMRTHEYELAQNGEIRHYEARFVPCGKNEVFSIVRNITDRKHAEAEREVLQHFAQAMTGQLTLEQIARLLAKETRRLFAHDAYWFGLYEEECDQLKSLYSEDTPVHAAEPVEARPNDFAARLPLTAQLKAGEPLLMNRERGSDSTIELSPFGEVARRSRSLMFVPIVWKNRMFALVSVQSYTANRYQLEDLKLFQSLVNQCSAAVARVQAVKALRESEELFRSLSACSPVGVFVTDAAGELSYISPRCHTVLGMTLEESQLRRWPELVEAEDRARVQAKWSECVGQGHEFAEEFRWRTGLGSVRWLYVRTSQVCSEAGALSGHVGIVEDITVRKLAEEALRKSHSQLQTMQSRYEMILHATSQGLCLLDKEWNVIFANEALCQSLQLATETVSEARPLAFASLFSSEQSFQAYVGPLGEALKGARTDVQCLELRRADGVLKGYEVSTVAAAGGGYVLTMREMDGAKPKDGSGAPSCSCVAEEVCN